MALLKLKGVKSYSAEKEVDIDLSQPVTLIYGQNGSGKSTISGYFSGYHPEKYLNCSFQSNEEFKYFVFNQEYIDYKFHNEAYQAGIFTLNEGNLGLNKEINKNKNRITEIQKILEDTDKTIEDKTRIKKTVIDTCAKDIFERTINDRKLLEYFLNGAKRTVNFYQKMRDIRPTPLAQDAEQIAEQLKQLLRSRGTKFDELSELEIYGLPSEITKLLLIPLVASSDTQFAAMVQQLGNADWVRSGTKYIHDDTCPFCQQNFHSQSVFDELSKMFDKSYEEAIEKLSNTDTKVSQEIELLESFTEHLRKHPAVDDDSHIFNTIKSLQQVLRSQLESLSKKIEKPSQAVSSEKIGGFNQLLKDELATLNIKIKRNNQLATNFDKELSHLEADALNYLRNLSNNYLVKCDEQLKEIEYIIESEHNKTRDLIHEKLKLSKLNSKLIEQMSVIQPTINNINNNLKLLGITDFSIICHDETLKLYRLQRQSFPKDNQVFKSLSEGEKTIIALLYFIESCYGQDIENKTSLSKLIVIDDPISSLSHNYIYEVASMIKRKLISTKLAKHIIILTHNIFFFQEIMLSTYKRLAPERTTPKNCSLYRIVKGSHSDCIPLSMHDMLNEYQALWQTLRDVREKRSLPVVLPNTMRNILEYYFSFSSKQEKLEKALDKLATEYSAGDYDSFYRAINRHSHSDGRNILSTGVIDVDMYFRLFQKIFEETKDIEHYNAMMGIQKLAKDEADE